MAQAKWIWYYGDFERLHLRKVNARRTERDYAFPAFWKQPEVYSNVRFTRNVTFSSPATFTVTAKGIGYVEVGEQRFPLSSPVCLNAGSYKIKAHVYNESGLPCVFVQGDLVSDENWLCSPYGEDEPVGCYNMYVDQNDDPNVFKFAYEQIFPVSTQKRDGGVLYDYGTETFARICSNETEPFAVYFGETEQEAVDTDFTYTFHIFAPTQAERERKAYGFRYLYVPDLNDGRQPKFDTYYEFLSSSRPRASFASSDELLDKIWRTAGKTLELNSREFYIDGIKRDRWVWSGDAYQSYFINRYYAFDRQIAERTVLALAGKDAVSRHINTINDYTFYWIMSVYETYQMTGNLEFVRRLYPRMKEFLDFCLSRVDENGFVVARKGDWIFIDWAEMDKEGPLCAEQMLLLQSLRVFGLCACLLGEEWNTYRIFSEKLQKKIDEKFWDAQKGAYIDGFVSGRRNVTRHANIFALLFGIATPSQRESIVVNVLQNDAVPSINTPYFKFYELEATCLIGEYDKALQVVRAYWGEMIEAGATSFWEEFVSGVPASEQLSMYGQKYGKSLCHAWGASPIYTIGRHLLGVYPTSAGYATFCVQPHLDGLQSVNAVLPVGEGSVSIVKQNGTLTVCSTIAGGTLCVGDKSIPMMQNTPYVLNLME